ncbi:FxsA family protein [Mesorhizobium sp. CAU 1741]|uniref:FxsA family protein n=1 Tax=Mesorhizobium sp. CAU 1741 TaxID=3140366 RepID=UPI00325AED6F
MIPRLAPLIFILMPLIEIAVFVIVGGEIGALATVGLVIATTILGAILLRVQGFGIMTRLRESMEQGGRPGRELVHGFMVMIAGVLLFLPGFVTDAIGLVLFIPAVRDFAWRYLASRIVVVTPNGPQGYRRPRDSRTIDLDANEYAQEEPEESAPRRLRDDR